MMTLFTFSIILGLDFVHADRDVFGIDSSHLSEARLYSGNTTESSELLFERSLTDFDVLEKRQQCVMGWGTCPGGVTCGCPLNSWNCCGTLCKAVVDTCCSGYVCPSGWGCCGSDTCYPYGGDCCSNGRYCDPGEECIRLNGDAASIRCSVIGATSQVAATYATAPTPIVTTTQQRATITSSAAYTSIVVPADQTILVWYTRTFTIYYYIYTVTTTTYTFATSTSHYTHVSYDYTSFPTVLSCQATASAMAVDSMSDSARTVQASVSSSAESVGDELSSSLSQATRAATTTRSTAASSRGAAATATSTGTGVSSGSGVTSFARRMKDNVNGLVLLGTAAIVASVLMVGL